MHECLGYTAHIYPTLITRKLIFISYPKLIQIYPPNGFFIIFIYRPTARKSGLQIFVHIVKYLVIFFWVLTSEKIEAKFLFVVKLLGLLYDCGVHQVKKNDESEAKSPLPFR